MTNSSLTRLPTNFFPAPGTPEPHSPTTEIVSGTNQKDGSMDRYQRTIVIAYDQSNYADAMISKAICLGIIRPTDDIRLVHIISQSDYRNLLVPLLSGNTIVTRGYIDDDVKLDDISSAMIWEVVNALRRLDFKFVSSEVLRGDPKETISDYCHAVKPVYLICGTRGFGAIKRSILGSISSYLTKNCPCPVLVVKLEHREIEARKELQEKKRATFAEVYAQFCANHLKA
ncbi:hypothetical protein EDC96DRAFT_514535 [Choanephora cucurbitarum]|nr:hypothetical protein EDC96DRAFT_514535 [Choanephora cucurbitarum]